MKDKVKVEQNELWMLSLSTMRYAHGRMSAIPSDITEFIVRHFKDFETSQIEQFARETAEELDRVHKHGEPLGMQCDDNVWSMFLQRCVDEVYNRKLNHE
jgi:urate oxidase